jgi:hypothetical protein
MFNDREFHGVPTFFLPISWQLFKLLITDKFTLVWSVISYNKLNETVILKHSDSIDKSRLQMQGF